MKKGSCSGVLSVPIDFLLNAEFVYLDLAYCSYTVKGRLLRIKLHANYN